jgi:hypothetical protein
MSLSPKTLEVLAEIKNAIASGQKTLCPAIFSHCFSRAATSAAFRAAKQQGIIELAYMSCVGTAIWQAAGVKQASEEAKTAVKH